jgi:hypothetical protein
VIRPLRAAQTLYNAQMALYGQGAAYLRKTS